MRPGGRAGAHYRLAPLQVTCEEIFQAGFLIERVAEPRPVPEATAIDPGDYDKLTREPGASSPSGWSPAG